MFNFKKERVNKENQLGEGSFGKVYPYQKDPQDNRWVVKRIKMSKLDELLKCLPEIVIGFACDHPCIIPVKGYSVHNEGKKYYLHLKLPRMKGSLIDEFRVKRVSKAYYSQEKLVKYFYELVCGVDYLHTKKIFHGDIKLNNVLIDYKGNVRLSDIGSAKYVPEEDYYNVLTGAHGAQDYKAPEIIKYEKELREYSRKNSEERVAKDQPTTLKKESLFLVDSWSLGLAILELAILEIKPINPHQSVEQIQEELGRIRKEAGKRYERGLLELLFGLLNVNMRERLKVSEVKRGLEEQFGDILTEEFKEEMGLKAKEEIKIEDGVKVFNEEKERALEKLQRSHTQLEEKLLIYQEKIKVLQSKVDELTENRVSLEDSPKSKTIEECKEEEETKLFKERLLKANNQLERKWFKWFVFSVDDQRLDIQAKNDHWLYDFFGNHQFDDKMLEEFSKNLVEICLEADVQRKLKGLMITAHCNQFTNEGVRALMGYIFTNFISLERIVLSFPECPKITDVAIKDLSAFLERSVPHLKEFCLSLPGNVKITKEGLNKLMVAMGTYHPNLSFLVLDLKGCTKLGEEDVKNLALQIRSYLTKLTGLQFFVGGDKINDETVKGVVMNLSGMFVNVTALDLTFCNSKKITDQALKSIAEQMQVPLDNLSKFGLSFQGCPRLTDKGLQSIGAQVKVHMKNLQRLLLDFQGCPLVTLGCKKETEEELKHISSVEIY